MTRVLDAQALMVFLEREPGYEKVKEFFVEAAQARNNLLMTSVNFGEIYYIVLREYGRQKVDEVEKIIQTLPIELVTVDIPLAKEAAMIKAAKRISYADCFAGALARSRSAQLITGDREFQKLEQDIDIVWIGETGP